jgi:hypothetical protein
MTEPILDLDETEQATILSARLDNLACTVEELRKIINAILACGGTLTYNGGLQAHNDTLQRWGNNLLKRNRLTSDTGLSLAQGHSCPELLDQIERTVQWLRSLIQNVQEHGGDLGGTEEENELAIIQQQLMAWVTHELELNGMEVKRHQTGRYDAYRKEST